MVSSFPTRREAQNARRCGSIPERPQLPSDLLQPALDRKVRHLFLRGDHDTAVFQAFKEVEVAVRKAGGYTDGDLGKDLMTKAFNPDMGRLAT